VPEGTCAAGRSQPGRQRDAGEPVTADPRCGATSNGACDSIEQRGRTPVL